MSRLYSLGLEIDRTLRGGRTLPADLRAGRIAVPVPQLVVGCLLFGIVYGLAMGLFGSLRVLEQGPMYLVSSAVKVPLVFLLTLLVTFPSLYTFSALAGSRLGAVATLRLLLIAVTVHLALLAGFAPVTAFFVICTESYVFVKLLNVLCFAVSGAISLVFLRRALAHVFGGAEQETSVAEPVAEERGVGAGNDPDAVSDRPRTRRPRPADRALVIFRVWFVIYAIVGAQMGWVLRPFVGSPELPFEWFRATESNILLDVLRSLGALLG